MQLMLGAIQHAIVSLRTHDLETHQERGSEPDDAAEYSARDQALQALRLSGDRDPCQLWLQLCLYKHRGRLVAARRRLIEFISLLSESLTCSQILDHVFRRSIQMIQSTFAYPELERQFLEQIDEFLPFCHQGNGRQSGLVHKALQCMIELHREPIGLSEIAEHVHVSAAHLSRTIKQECGQTATDILHGMRLSSAKQQLAETDDGILQIALHCGFPSVEHFHRVFKRHSGMTPRQWRQLHS